MDRQWLSISLYCDQEHFHHLLKNGVSPALTCIKKRGSLVAWSFEFNGNGGPNIRLSILTLKDRAHETSLLIASFFESFFKQVNYRNCTHAMPGKELYMPFPGNSVQFGLYLTDDSTANDHDLNMLLSEVLLDALSDDIIDNDSLFSICLYLHFSLALTINKHAEIYNGEILHDLPDLGRIIIDDDIKGLANDIFADVSHQTVFANENAWFIRWEKICESATLSKQEKQLPGLIARKLQIALPLLELVYVLTAKYCVPVEN